MRLEWARQSAKRRREEREGRANNPNRQAKRHEAKAARAGGGAGKQKTEPKDKRRQQHTARAQRRDNKAARGEGTHGGQGGNTKKKDMTPRPSGKGQEEGERGATAGTTTQGEPAKVRRGPGETRRDGRREAKRAGRRARGRHAASNEGPEAGDEVAAEGPQGGTKRATREPSKNKAPKTRGKGPREGQEWGHCGPDRQRKEKGEAGRGRKRFEQPGRRARGNKCSGGRAAHQVLSPQESDGWARLAERCGQANT